MLSSPEPSTFVLFATALAAGVAAVLLVVPLALVGRRFFVLMSLIALVLTLLAIAASGLDIGYLHIVFAGLLILYNVVLPRQSGVDLSARREAAAGGPGKGLSVFSRWVLIAASLCGAAALAADALDYPLAVEISAGEGPWLAAAFLSAALLLGASLTAMVLGHWYLVLRKLSFSPLSRVTLLLIVALSLRAAVAAASIWLQGERWEALRAEGSVAFLLNPGIFLLARVVFGFIAPAILAGMAWQCVRIRSNQSATGIFYVNLAFVVIGEIIAKYFLVSEGLLI